MNEKKPISSLIENENLKRGDRKNKTEKTPCPYAKMKEIKKGDRLKKKKSFPCMKMKISKRGTKKTTTKKHDVPMRK